MGPMPNHVSANWGTWRGLPEGMSQMFPLMYLGNGWADCVEIWHALGDPLVTAYAIVTGGVSLHVRTCRDTPHTALLYLGNGLADCVQIWYVCWGSLTKCLPQVIQGDFFTGQKVNSNCDTNKHVQHINKYVILTTTLGHLR